MDDPNNPEIPRLCTIYDFSIIGRIVTIHFYYRPYNAKQKTEKEPILISSIAFDVEQCKMFLLSLLGQIQKGESPPDNRSRF